MQIHSVGIDLGKTTFHLVAFGASGKVLVKKKFTQKQLLGRHGEHADLSDRDGGVFRGAFPGRALHKQGHDVRLIPPQILKLFVTSNKNDFIDAEAIAEAVEHKNARFVPIKTDDHLDLQAIPSSARPAHCAAYGSNQPAEGVSASTWLRICMDASQAQGLHDEHP